MHSLFELLFLPIHMKNAKKMEIQLLHPLQNMHNAGSIMMYQYHIIVIEKLCFFPFTCKQEAHVLKISPLETVFENLQAKMEEKKPFFQYLDTGPKSCLIESSYFIDVGFIMLFTALISPTW